jgi:hypothetical protein
MFVVIVLRGGVNVVTAGRASCAKDFSVGIWGVAEDGLSG